MASRAPPLDDAPAPPPALGPRKASFYQTSGATVSPSGGQQNPPCHVRPGGRARFVELVRRTLYVPAGDLVESEGVNSIVGEPVRRVPEGNDLRPGRRSVPVT